MKKISFIFCIMLMLLGLIACEEPNDHINEEAVENVIELIDELPNAVRMTLEDEEKVVLVRGEYNKLNNLEKEKVTNFNKLERVENKLKELKLELEEKLVQEVNELIDQLPNVSDLDLSYGNLIKEIREKYNALSEGAKLKVNKYFTFEIIEEEYSALLKLNENTQLANNVIALIEKLPTQDKVALSNEQQIINVREKYEALPDEAKYLVLNYDKLVALEVVIEALKHDSEYDVRDVLECISDVANTNTMDELIISNEYVDVEWFSSNNDLYYFENGYGKVSILNQTHRKQNVEITAKITRKSGVVVELSKLITINPVLYEELPDTPVATYFAAGALSSYKKNSERYKLEGTIFSENAKEVLDILYYAFAHIDADGNVRLDNDPNLAEIMELKKHNVRIIICIHGVSTESSKAFKTVTANDTLRAKFVKNLMNLVENYKFDGIDIDWESTSGSYVVASSMNKLMKDLREEMTSRQDPGGTPYFLSAAVPASSWGAANDRFDLATLNNYVDYINMMSYDLNKTDLTTHLSPLYTSSNDNGYGFGCSYGVNLFVSKGLSKNKIIIGAAGYGKAYKLSGSTGSSTYPALGVSGSLVKISSVSSGSFASGTLYGNAITELIATGNFTKYIEYNNDNKIVGSYLYDSKNKLFVTYDSEEVLAAKYQYASNSMGMGIMCWSYTEDTSDNYINSIYNVMEK